MSVSTLTAEEVEPRQRLTKWLIGAASVVMLAGLLFGCDQGVIGGALDGIKKSFDIGTFAIEVITSWVTLGALVGALIAGGLADKVGRRQTIILAAILFTSAIRGRGVAGATSANWGSAWLVTQFFLTLTDSIGESATFYLFAVMCVAAFVFIWFLLPETRGRSLAQIQQMWERGTHRRPRSPQPEKVVA